MVKAIWKEKLIAESDDVEVVVTLVPVPEVILSKPVTVVQLPVRLSSPYTTLSR